jgi:hypothetical protein
VFSASILDDRRLFDIPRADEPLQAPRIIRRAAVGHMPVLATMNAGHRHYDSRSRLGIASKVQDTRIFGEKLNRYLTVEAESATHVSLLK